MIRKCLIALILTAIVGGSVVQADPSWGVTTAMVWDWAKKEVTIDVYIKVVRWAQIYTKWAIVLTQQTSSIITDRDDDKAGMSDFMGCTWIQVCQNFANLQIDGKVEALSGYEDLAANGYRLSILDGGVSGALDLTNMNPGVAHPAPVFDGGKDGTDSLVTPGPWFTGNLRYISVCVAALDVDPQHSGMEFLPDTGSDLYNGKNMKKVALVTLTYFPADAPGAADFACGAVTGAPPYGAVDLGAGPYPSAPIPNGDGAYYQIPAAP